MVREHGTVTRQEDHDDQLPIELGPVSNGETYPVPPSPMLREVERRARDLIERQSRRRGMPRRDFLRTAMASAAVLFVLDACSSEENGARGGGMRVPEDATVDPDAAREALGGEEFVFDVQTHFLDLPQGADPGFPQSACGAADVSLCYSVDRYLEEIFLRSDTNLAVVSAIPATGEDGPLSPARMDEARRTADALCGDGRIIMHGQAMPALGELGARLDAMSALADEYPIGAWKVYTHAPRPGWYLDDHDPSAPQVGQAFLDRVRESGIKTVCVHKGFGGVAGGAAEFSSPVDIGPAAKANPDIAFVVYHSGYESAVAEGPYDPAGQGVDRLVTSLRDSGIGPGQNVYCELGSTWFSAMRDPDEAAHVLGKVLTAVGPERVAWGTDSIWYGTPQGQIQAFRTFEITPEYQERFGYPALTPAVKQRILGLNSADLYEVDPITTRCEFTPEELEAARQALPARPASYGPRTAEAVRQHLRDHGWIGF